MAQLTKTEFDIQTANLFPTNGVGAISALDLRTQMDNIADSFTFKTTGAASAPTANDDGVNTGGNGAFEIGDTWIDETNDVAYVCLDNAPTAAIWAVIASSSGSVSIDGTPADNQLAIWTGTNAIEGDANLTWDGSAFNVSGNITTSGTVDGRDVAADGTKLDGIGAGANVAKVGTPVNNQVGVWTGDGTIEGDAGFTWDGTTLSVGSQINITGNGGVSDNIILQTTTDVNQTIPGIVFNNTAGSEVARAYTYIDTGTPALYTGFDIYDTLNAFQGGMYLYGEDAAGRFFQLWDGTNDLVVVDQTGDMTVRGNVIADYQVRTPGSGAGGLFFEINAGTGVADPVNPLGGDPFDGFESMFAWITKRYIHADYIYANVAAGTYNFTGNLALPTNIGRLEFYGATRATTILNLGGGTIETAPHQGITIGSCTINNCGYFEVGGLYLFDTDLELNVQWAYINGGLQFNDNGNFPDVGALASVIHNSAITFTNVSSGAFIVSNTQLVLSNSVTIDVTTAINGKGYVIRAENALVYLDADANIDIQDRLASSPVDGEILIARGSTYIEHPSAVYTVGSVTFADDNYLLTKAESIPNIVAKTASYTLALTDRDSIQEIDSTLGAVVITIPTNAAVAFPVGTIINFTNIDNTSAISIAGDTGVTLNGVSAGSGTFNGTLYEGVTLYKRATNEWVVQGAIGAVI